MQPFLDAIDQRVLVCDGAMGTMLYAKGIFLNRCFDELNLADPDLVGTIHRQYVHAGADVIESNTFGANRVKLASFGLADRVADINREGAAIARRASLGRAWVAGSMGPLGVRIAPWGRTTVADAGAVFREQASALAAGGVDLFLLETFRDLDELKAAVRAIRDVSALPIVAQMTTGDDGNTLDGAPPEIFAPSLEQAGADVIGLNCSVGPAAMLEAIESIGRLTNARLAAQPNAGRPRDVEGRTLYLSSPEYMATYAKRFVAAGVRLVGGCCGTTPDHIRQIAAAVRASVPARRPAVSPRERTSPMPGAPVDRRDKSRLARALSDGQFVAIAEVTAPRGVDLSEPVADARRFEELGAVAVNVPDYPQSGARASAMALAALVERAEVETLLHCTARHRSLVDLQSDLVGAHALGIRNLLLTTGRDTPIGLHDESGGGTEVDSIGLLALVSRLNHGLDVGEQSLPEPTAFHVGVAVNPFADDAEAEWRRLARKVEAGAEFIVTPPVLDVHAFVPVLRRLRETGLPVIAGIAPLQGLRHAEFLASEVVGVRVAEDVLGRLRGARDERREAMAITDEIVSLLRADAQGLQVTSFRGSTSAVERLLGGLAARSPKPALGGGVKRG